MPDDMLEDAIQISKKTLDEHDFETDGVEVSFILFKDLKLKLTELNLMIFFILDCKKSEKVHG